MNFKNFKTLKERVFKNYRKYEKKLNFKSNIKFNKNGYFFLELDIKKTKILQNYFFKLDKKFYKIDHNYKKIDKNFIFNALYFSKDPNQLQVQKTLSNYYYPKDKIVKTKLIKFIEKNIIKKCENFLRCKLSVVNCVIEISKSEKLTHFINIIKNNKNLKKQTNFTWHKDGYPEIFKKILIYPFSLSKKNGTISIKKNSDSNVKTFYSKKSSFLLFENSKVLHKGILPKNKNLIRPLIQLTVIPIKSKKFFYFKPVKNRLYPINSPKI